jgi:diguanylate cyclase (GGDEF)-like protein
MNVKARGKRRRGALVGLTVAGLIVLALLSVFAIELSNTQAKSRQDVIARVHERSVLAAALIDSLLQSAEQQRTLYEARYGGPAVTGQMLDRVRQQNLYAVLLDRQARVLAASKGFTAQARADLAQSAALALVRSGRPYGLGNVLPYGKSGVINFAVAFPTPSGTRYLLTGISPRALNEFLVAELRRIPGVKGAHNYVIDGTNTILASTNPARPAGYRVSTPGAVTALRSPSGDRGGYFYDRSPITNSTWKIILAAPNGPLFATVSGLRGWLPWLIFAGFALMAAVALWLGARVVRSAERDLRHANDRLEAVNEQLEEANATLAHDALHDPLTGLPNRALLMDRLAQMLHRAQREPSAGCAVLFIDLDRFKLVNDSLSHAVGDQLLIALAARFQEAIRPGDTVARLGGDEFAVLLHSIHAPQEAEHVADRVQGSLSDPIEIGPHRLFTAASIGIALGSAGTSAGELLRNSDIAMYEAKQRGRGGHALFDDSMQHRQVHRLGQEHDLRRAIEESLLEVHYQPIIELSTGRISALEALARWPADWPEVPPAEFIRVAEETGLIGDLGQHVLREALRSLASWRRDGAVSDEVRISVNLSPRQLDDPSLPEKILSEIARAGITPDALRLEITESTLVHESDQISRLISRVCSSGVGLHLDDFGTQYSSLTALQQLPLLALKIDRSFVGDLTRHSNGEAMVRGIIALAHGLGLSTIAEGIETPAELQRLVELGCHYGQGFLLARPLDKMQLQELAANWDPVKVAALGRKLTEA